MMGQGMMNGGQMMMGWGGMFFGALMMIAFWALIIYAVVMIFSWANQGGFRSSSDALNILKERFAAGEIDVREFEERRIMLT